MWSYVFRNYTNHVIQVLVAEENHHWRSVGQAQTDQVSLTQINKKKMDFFVSRTNNCERDHRSAQHIKYYTLTELSTQSTGNNTSWNRPSDLGILRFLVYQSQYDGEQAGFNNYPIFYKVF